MFSKNELITNTEYCREFILKKYQTKNKIITPIGVDCYSSFLAKEVRPKNCGYVPSLFGFRNLGANFFVNYIKAMSEDNPWLLPGKDAVDTGYNLSNKIDQFEGVDGIHELKTPFGLFLLNHDAGSHSRPYSKEILNNQVTDRLAFLELVTHTLFYKMKEAEEIVLLASGPHTLKDKIIGHFRDSPNEFRKNLSLLFISQLPPSNGSQPPTVSYANGDLEFAFYKEHPFYGNVAQNWSILNTKTTLMAQEIIENNLTLKFTAN